MRKFKFSSGFPAILVLLLASAVLLVGGSYYYKSRNHISLFNKPALTSDSTANWKTYKFIDSTGFGYELKLPTKWYSSPWAGENDGQEPYEIAQNFYGESCGTQSVETKQDDRFYVIHHSGPHSKLDFEEETKLVKEDGFSNSKIIARDGTPLERWIVNKYGYTDIYVFVPSSKGYYEIFSRVTCTPASEFKPIFDQILSTFKFINQ